MIENLDWNIRRFIEAIDAHEESVRIPSVFRWPGVIPQTGSTNKLISLVDPPDATNDSPDQP